MDGLAVELLRLVNEEQRQRRSRRDIFARLWARAAEKTVPLPRNYALVPRAAIPYMDEPWYC